MKASTYKIFDKVYEAMQEAEELNGPDFYEYMQLMRKISNEAQDRIIKCSENRLNLSTF
jgi:hypothetical protein